MAGPEGEYQMLHEAFLQYTECLRNLNSELSKAKLNHLGQQLQAEGVHGFTALELLQRHSDRINWHSMQPELFSVFYRFVYFLCREPGKRNVQVRTAVAGWQLLLRGRFRLLDRFVAYVGGHHKAVVLEDTWRQVLDFSRTVHEDLSNYDAGAAWPVLLDEFVESMRCAGGGGGGSAAAAAAAVAGAAVSGSRSAEPLDPLNPFSSDRTLTAVSPRSGSKRRMPDILDVVDQLQQLPLGSSSEQQQHDGGSTSTSSGGDAAASEPSTLRVTAPKRFRAAGSGQTPRQPSVLLGAFGGSSGGGSGGGEADFTMASAEASTAAAAAAAAAAAGGAGGAGEGAAASAGALFSEAGMAGGFGGCHLPWNNSAACAGGDGALAMDDGSMVTAPQQHQQQQHGAFLPPPPLLGGPLRAPRIACSGAFQGSGSSSSSTLAAAPAAHHHGHMAPCGPFASGGGTPGSAMQLPPTCPSLGGGAGGAMYLQQQHQQQQQPHQSGGGAGAARHSGGVNAMLQVTVTQALGLGLN